MNPRESALPRPVAMRLAATEYDRCAEMFRSLRPAQWATATDCPAWNVRQMAAHMLGMAEMAASIRENVRQQRMAAKVAGSGVAYVDALTQLQVDERADWTPEQITARYAARGPKAAAAAAAPLPSCAVATMSQLQEVNGVREPWTFGYLIDVILTRDPWMHRLDIAAATGHAAAADRRARRRDRRRRGRRVGRSARQGLRADADRPGRRNLAGRRQWPEPGPWTPSTSAGPSPAAGRASPSTIC